MLKAEKLKLFYEKHFHRLAQGHEFAWVDFTANYREDRYTRVANIDDANGVSSFIRHRQDPMPSEEASYEGQPYKYTAMHKPVLDIDYDAALIPSSTEGHFHLMLDKEMTWDDYVKFLTVCKEVGILEPGYVDAALSHERKGTWIRTPWAKKNIGGLNGRVVVMIQNVSGTTGDEVCSNSACEAKASLMDISLDDEGQMFAFCQDHAPAYV